MDWKTLKMRPPFVAALAVAAALMLWLVLRGPSTTGPQASPRRAAPRANSAEEFPRIDLARLSSPPPPNRAGHRDLFEFGQAVPDPNEIGRSTPPPPPIAIATPAPLLTPPPSRSASINLKYIGSLEREGGVKVAVLVTDRNEILYGQVGQEVANRFKILKIGFESVEILDGSSGQNRRIPLRAN